MQVKTGSLATWNLHSNGPSNKQFLYVFLLKKCNSLYSRGLTRPLQMVQFTNLKGFNTFLSQCNQTSLSTSTIWVTTVYIDHVPDNAKHTQTHVLLEFKLPIFNFFVIACAAGSLQ